MQRKVLDSWDTRMNEMLKPDRWTLQRAAFTALFAWNRQEDGSWLNEMATTDKNMWKNYEGDDDEDSGMSLGSEEDFSSNDDDE